MRNKLNEYDVDFNVDNDADANNDVCVFPISGRPDPVDLEAGSVVGDDNIVIDVEDLLQLALDERKGKQEAKQVRKMTFLRQGLNPGYLVRMGLSVHKSQPSTLSSLNA